MRICDGCYVLLQRPNTKPAVRAAAESDLPAEYVNSSLSQQVQVCLSVVKYKVIAYFHVNKKFINNRRLFLDTAT